MAESVHCFTCCKVFVALTEDMKSCPSCSATNGVALCPERIREGHAFGVFNKLDPKTGWRAKRKR